MTDNTARRTNRRGFGGDSEPDPDTGAEAKRRGFAADPKILAERARWAPLRDRRRGFPQTGGWRPNGETDPDTRTRRG